VVPGRPVSAAALEDVTRRTIGKLGARPVRLVLLRPGTLHRLRARRIRQDLVEPAMPFRRHLGCLRRALVEHPPALPLPPTRALVAIVAVPELVGADQFAVKPGEDAGSDGHRPSVALTQGNWRSRPRRVPLVAAGFLARAAGGLWHRAAAPSSPAGPRFSP